MDPTESRFPCPLCRERDAVTYVWGGGAACYECSLDIPVDMLPGGTTS